MSERAKLAVKARRLYDNGLTGIDVADRLGISRSYAYSLLNDPTGDLDRERKQRYAGECEVCGAPTNGYNGRDLAATRCQQHNPVYEDRADAAKARTIRALALRKKGLLNHEIAKRMGTTAPGIAMLLIRPRVARYGLKYVPTPYGVGHPSRTAPRRKVAE